MRLFLALCVLVSVEAVAQGNFQSAATGNWSAAGSWTLVSGTDADGIPDSNDNVTILTGHTISVNVTSACLALTMNGTASLNFNTDGVTLTVNSLMTMNGTSTVAGTGATRTLSLQSDFIIPTGQIGSIAGITVSQLSSANFTILGEFRPTNATGTKTLGNVLINSGGTSTGIWAAQVACTYSVQTLTMYDGPSGQSLIGGAGLLTLTITGVFTVQATTANYQSKIANVTLTANGATTVSGSLYFTVATGTKIFNNNVTVNSGGTWDNTIGHAITINGNIVNNGNWPAPSSGGYYTISAGVAYAYSGTGTINMGRLSIPSGITITNNGLLTLQGDTSIGLDISNFGSFINAGYLTFTASDDAITVQPNSTLNLSSSPNTVDFGRSGDQYIYTTTYYNLTVSGSGTKTLVNDVSVTNQVTISGSAILDASNRTFNGAANLVMSGTSNLILGKNDVNLPELTGSSNTLGSSTTITLSGTAAQTLKSSSTYPYANVVITDGSTSLANVSNILGNLTVSGSGSISAIPNGAGLTVGGTFTMSSSGTVNISGGSGNLTASSITLSGSGTLNYSGKTMTVNGASGAWTNNGINTITTNGTSSVVFTGGTSQTIAGTSTTTFNNLTLNNTVTLSASSATVSGTLALGANRLITGSNYVVASTITRTSGYVEGGLQKAIPTGTNVSVTFELGASSTYMPVTMLFASVSASGTGFRIQSTAGDHPDIYSAGLEPNFSVNRYWTITNIGSVTFTTVSVDFNFASSDVDAGFSPSSTAIIKGYTGTSWFTTTVGTRTATSVQFTGLSSSNFPNNTARSFQIGRQIAVSGFTNRQTGNLNWHSATTWINNRTGVITLTNGSATVTGSGTLFSTELIVGDQIVLQSLPAAAPYTIQSITNDLTLVLTTNSGTSTSGGYGRLKVPNTSVDSVGIGNQVFNGGPAGADAAVTITLDGNATVNSITFTKAPNTGRATSQQLTHSGTFALTVAGFVTINQPSAAATNSWNINAGSASVAGTLTIGSAYTSSTQIARVLLTTGTLTARNILWNTPSTNNREDVSVLNVGSGRVNLSGQLQYANDKGTLTMGATGIFNFNSTTSSQNLDLPATTAAFVFSNIECNNTSTSGVRITEDLTASNVTGNFRVLTGRLECASGGSADLVGAAGATFELANGTTLEMLGTGAQLFPRTYGTFSIGSTSTVKYSQTSAHTCTGIPTTFGNLMFVGTGPYTLPGLTLTINGGLTVGDGTFSSTLNGTGTNSLTINGDVSVATGATMTATNLQSITVNGNWTNNGTFTAGAGTTFVSFTGNGTSQPQTIGGSTSDIFYRLTVNGNDATDVVRLSKSIAVSNLLTLTNGGLDINGNQLSITNSATTAVSRASGYIKSETTAFPYSRVNRTINNGTGSYLYPFAISSVAADYIPFTLNVTTAGGPTGTFEVSTYATAADNTPYPTGVTHMAGTGGTDNSAQAVNRFWILTTSGFSSTLPTTTLTFTTTATEAAGVSGNLRAQRWSGTGWAAALAGQTNPTSTSASVPGVTVYSPWTLAAELTPLPITLLNFTAKPANGVVNIEWETASEKNNQFFEVERSQTGESFETVTRVEGAGNSTTLRRYSLVDTYPFSGISYYRLRQQDFDGTVSYSNVIRVEVTSAFSILAHPNPFDGTGLSINWRDGKPGDIMMVRLWTLSGGKAFDGQATLNQDLNAPIQFINPLSPGLYLIEIATQEGVQRLKVIVR